MRVNVKVKKLTLNNLTPKVLKAMETAMYDITDSASMTASDAAPIDVGVLRRSVDKTIHVNGNKVTGLLEYSVSEPNNSGDFNYALWIHEGEYQLGEKSEKAGGGYGLSGAHYPVGRKFLERVLYGEHEAYTKHMQEEIEGSI